MGVSSSNRYVPFIFDILGNSIYAVPPDLLARIGGRFDRAVMMENLSREGRLLSENFHYLSFSSMW